MKQHNTAILIFANSAQKDASRKAVRGSKQLFQKLNEQTLKTVRKTKLPFFQVTEDEQQGVDFGERFTNAIKSVYAKGYDNVITIGNDTPHLKTRHLLETAKQLQKNNFVLGPSTDGGFYLMGLHKSQFNENLFLKLPWQGRGLAKRIALLLSNSKVEVVKLEVLQDIDVDIDINAILNSAKRMSAELRWLILALTHSTIHYYSLISIRVSQLWFPRHYNKGSPFSLNS